MLQVFVKPRKIVFQVEVRVKYKLIKNPRPTKPILGDVIG